MLHHGGNKGVGAVGDGVGFGLDGVSRNLSTSIGRSGVTPTAAATYLLSISSSCTTSMPRRRGHTTAGPSGGNRCARRSRGPPPACSPCRSRASGYRVFHHLPEAVPVFGEVDRLGRCPQYLNPRLRKVTGDVERRLAAELDDDAFRFFLFVYGEHVFHRQGLEVELVRGVVIRGDGLGVAVHHDRFVTLVSEG